MSSVPTPRTPLPLAIAVLAGGASKRMGEEKARLSVQGVPLIARVIEAVAQLQPSDGLTIVGGGSDLAELAVTSRGKTTLAITHVPDDFPGEGPLGAIITALRVQELSAGSVGHVLTVACDLPDLHIQSLRHLVSETLTTDADLGVPLANGRRQWHVAVWNRRTLAQLEEAFANGTRSIWKASAPLRQTVVISPQVSTITDLDTPTDVADFVGKTP